MSKIPLLFNSFYYTLEGDYPGALRDCTTLTPNFAKLHFKNRKQCFFVVKVRNVKKRDRSAVI